MTASRRAGLDGLVAALRRHSFPCGTDAVVIRASQEERASRLVMPDGVGIERIRLGDLVADRIAPLDGRGPGVVLYLHGGGFTGGSLNTHRPLAAFVALSAEAATVLLDYRLAPEHPFPAAVDDAVAAYRVLLASGTAPSRVVLAGDSAGGGLVVAALVALRDAGVPLPAGAVAMSPWVDLTLRRIAPSSRDPQVRRCLLEDAARAYLAGHDARAPLASPVFADLGGLPPLLVHAGGRDPLVADAHALERAATAAGVDVRLEVWDDQLHVFHAFAPRLPDSMEAIGRIGAWVGHRFAGRAGDGLARR